MKYSYFCIMNFELEKNWRETVEKVSEHFGEILDMQSILFMIGVQELNKGFQKLSKDRKVDVMHIAVCSVLEPAGYYEFLGRDEDGWPHYENIKKIPHLNEMEQDSMMKEAIIEYFHQNLLDNNSLF